VSVRRAAVLVVSDRASRGEYADHSGPAAREILTAWGLEVACVDVVPDEPDAVRDRLRDYADRQRLDLVVTSGGTGLGPRDITPEATREVLTREAPGIGEFLRRETSRSTPFAALSRGTAGVRERTLIVNLPGSPRGVRESLDAARTLLEHALQVLRGEPAGHSP
jgi:molybdenum cofactor synthesis domain-containing protein